MRDGCPVIIGFQAWGDRDDYSDVWDEGHYAVVIGYDGNGFFLMDPSQIGYSHIGFTDLESRWHDMTKDGARRFYHLGIIVSGRAVFNPSEARPVRAWRVVANYLKGCI